MSRIDLNPAFGLRHESKCYRRENCEDSKNYRGQPTHMFLYLFLQKTSSLGLDIISPVKKEYMEQEHHQDHHQVIQYQVQLSERMLETTLLYMYIRQKMTLKKLNDHYQ